MLTSRHAASDRTALLRVDGAAAPPPPLAAAAPLPRLWDSNLAGLEEEGWITGVLFDTMRREHHDACTAGLLAAAPVSAVGTGDLGPCPCLAIPRRGLPPPGTHEEPLPFFYLKLHKVA